MLDIYGKPLVVHVLSGLANAGYARSVVNAAYLSEAFSNLSEAASPLGLDVMLSVQPEPYQHAGDLAFANPLWETLGQDEVFLAANGDTLAEIDSGELGLLAQEVTVECPIMILGDAILDGPLRVRDGQLVGIGNLDYPTRSERLSDLERWDDAGLKLMHSSLKPHLVEPGTTMSFHGENGLVGRVVASGGSILVREAPILDRAEIGTVKDYESRETNTHLRELVDRINAERLRQMNQSGRSKAS
ncbi:hypothetical protein BH23BAC4_BH23BAC4_15360 [soil metagenome]